MTKARRKRKKAKALRKQSREPYKAHLDELDAEDTPAEALEKSPEAYDGAAPLITSTVKLLRRFDQRIPAPRFLSSFFQTPPENIPQASERIALDIIRDDEELASAIQELSAGGSQDESVQLRGEDDDLLVLEAEEAKSIIRRAHTQAALLTFAGALLGSLTFHLIAEVLR